jgi:DNA-binding transcriptional MerR regulator
MAKQLRDGEWYLSPSEASAILQISYKTLQRWAEIGTISVWIGNGTKKKVKKHVKIDVYQSPTGYRYYKRDSIERLASEIAA